MSAPAVFAFVTSCGVTQRSGNCLHDRLLTTLVSHPILGHVAEEM
jgi:hypothetical protein